MHGAWRPLSGTPALLVWTEARALSSRARCWHALRRVPPASPSERDEVDQQLPPPLLLLQSRLRLALGACTAAAACMEGRRSGCVG